MPHLRRVFGSGIGKLPKGDVNFTDNRCTNTGNKGAYQRRGGAAMPRVRWEFASKTTTKMAAGWLIQAALLSAGSPKMYLF